MSRNSWNHLGLQSADGMLEALSFRVWIREPDWESKMKAFTEDPTHRKHLVRVEWHTLNLKSGEISETLSTMPPDARPGGTAVACGNRLYVLGGVCVGDPSCPDLKFDSNHNNNCVFYFDCARPGCGWQRAPPMLVPRRIPSAVAIEGKIYVFGSTPPTECCFAEVFNIHENRWDMLPPPPVSSLDLLCSSDPVLFDHSRSRILVHFSTNHSLYAFSPAPDGGSWECLDTEFWSWANASAIVDDVAYFLFDPISDWGMELYPCIGKSFDIEVFTNCRFGMMSWAVLAITYCIKQYEANAKSFGFGACEYYIDACVCYKVLLVGSWLFEHNGHCTRARDVPCQPSGEPWITGMPMFTPKNYGHYILALYILVAGILCIYINYDCDRQRQEFRRTSGKCKIWGKAPSKIEATYTTTSGETKTSLLLTSGWWGLARHFHYVPEILAAFFWTVPALFNHFLPYFYVVFSYHPLIRLSQKG
ncbi:hypothetical protein V6N11_063805 [Hibiscus sabdariffa]|uniref:7-dehydrocholesterol reductase n=1 Tax=Hibiscus sabdariffa TaxID=183260 RepID=A0ABR2PLR0_9ROSI